MALMCIACGEKPAPPTPGPDPEPPVPGPEPVETLASKIITEWHCVVSDIDADIYLQFGNFFDFEPERGGRCLKCFKLRLLRTAEYAMQRGIKVITTTLASSRWKSLDQINEAGLWACRQVQEAFEMNNNQAVPPYDSVIWWNRNWRKNGLQERRLQIIKEYDFYNQLYCGCEFSMRKDL